jgi:replicative DNA helicase Mcm
MSAPDTNFAYLSYLHIEDGKCLINGKRRHQKATKSARESLEEAIADFNKMVTEEKNEKSRRAQDRVLSVSETLRSEQGKEYSVYGMISSVSPVFLMVRGQWLFCPSCKKEEHIEYEIALPQPESSGVKCSACNKSMQAAECDYFPVISVEIMDTDTFSDIERLTALFFGDDTKGINVGERVIVIGRLHIIQNRKKGKLFPVLHASAVLYEARDKVELTPIDIGAIERFVKQKEDKIIEELVKMHSPQIIGYNFVKEGLLLLEANTGADIENRERNRIHAALVGPPGVAKTLLLKASVRHVPNSRYESGQHSSGRSLTAIIAREEDMHILRLGPAALAREGICAINEAGRMAEDDQAHLLDVLEEGSFTVNKYGFNARIRADTAIIISANPRHTTWRNNDGDSKIDLNEIPALKELLDRLDLIFPIKPIRDEQEIREYAHKKSQMEDRAVANYDIYLRKHIQYSKSIKPVISEEAKSILNEAYIKLAQTFGTPRIRNSLFRLTRARARLKLKKIADEQDAKETIAFYNAMIQQFTEIVAIPESPSEVAYGIMADILKASKLPILLGDLAEKASQQNKQVEAYLQGSRDIGSNWKLRRVLQALLNHSKIKQVQDRPVALQWMEENLEGQKPQGSPPPSDVTDVSEGLGKKENKGHDVMQGRFASVESTHALSDTSVTSDSTVVSMRLIKCPFCKFKNIYQETIDHHIRYGHKDKTPKATEFT